MKTGREKGDSRATGACRTRSPCHRNNGTISGDDGVIAEGSMVGDAGRVISQPRGQDLQESRCVDFFGAGVSGC